MPPAVQDDATYRHRLVDGLVARRILRTPAIEAAFRTVGRHHFLPDLDLEAVYRDGHLTAKEEDGWRVVTSTGPWLMATMLEQLQPGRGRRILEIGAGTGYNAALLAHLVGREGQITSLDIDADAVAWARRGLGRARSALGPDAAPVTIRQADGFLGDPDGAPWDAILVTVRTDRISPHWLDQLAPDGRLVVPLALGGVRHGQLSIAFDAIGDHLESRSIQDCGFVRPRGAMALDDRELALGDRPGLLWGDAGRHPIGSDELLALLDDVRGHQAVGFCCSRRALIEDFQPWLVVRDGDTCSVRAEGPWADWSKIVPLVARAGRFRGSGGLFDGRGIGLLGSRTPPGSEPEWVVARHGGGDAAERLVGRLHEWNAAGRPRRGELRLRLDRPGDGPEPRSATGLRLRETWGDLLVDWLPNRDDRETSVASRP